MTSAQVVETSVNVNNSGSFQNYTNSDDHTQPTTDTPGLKPFTVVVFALVEHVKTIIKTIIKASRDKPRDKVCKPIFFRRGKVAYQGPL